MKKLLVLMLVLGMASLANATVIDVMLDGIGDADNLGTSTDPLDTGETIYLKMVLNANPYTGYPSYDGYLLSAMDLNLTASGNATMEVDRTLKGVAIWGEHDDWTFVGDANVVSNVLDTGPYASTLGIDGADDNVPILWGFYITASGSGDETITLTWSLNDPPGQYADFKSAGGGPFGSWKNITLGDLGTITIHQVPEPATIALLGLGGLCLLRRRR